MMWDKKNWKAYKNLHGSEENFQETQMETKLEIMHIPYTKNSLLIVNLLEKKTLLKVIR